MFVKPWLGSSTLVIALAIGGCTSGVESIDTAPNACDGKCDGVLAEAKTLLDETRTAPPGEHELMVEVPEGTGALTLRVVPTAGRVSLFAYSDNGPVVCNVSGSSNEVMCRIAAPPTGPLHIEIEGFDDSNTFQVVADARPGVDSPLLHEFVTEEELVTYEIDVAPGSLALDATLELFGGRAETVLRIGRATPDGYELACEGSGAPGRIARCIVESPGQTRYQVEVRGRGAELNVAALVPAADPDIDPFEPNDDTY